ncbi:FIG045085: Hypothetical protein [Sphingobium indicum BiD32]|uniref:DUF4175 domain-containing protein n=1 Tax=Sphingobium indicum BiD32 TaxID=1301087 RepID=N1MNM3_9SPHN|nr:DUF4175 family protein [Sphingobium indicum]CCW17073.1 FIG045085: Hypothetical protein [Sphingobium indicum BiD32]
MNADELLARWTAPAKRRVITDSLSLALPLVLAPAAIGWRLSGILVAVMIVVIGAAIALLFARHRAQRYDQRWLVRALDASRADMEDSADLLFADPAKLGPLEQLQQARLADRIDRDSPQSLRPDWSRRATFILWIAALLVIGLVIFWPRPGHGPPTLAPSTEALPATPGIPRLVAQNLRIIPPAYTGLPPRDSASLDTRAPVGSRIEWTLRFDPQATVPAIQPVGSAPITLRRDSANWVASRSLDASFLYRVDPASGRGPTPPLHRIDAVADSPPQLRALSPAASLTMVTQGQRSWSPVFAATDDYGVAATARLRVTLAIGEGENVTFSEREIAISGSGPARDRRFSPRLDFGALGFGAGGDMVVQLIVRDTRQPAAQEVRGPSLILRWPSPKQPESGGLQGMVNTTLPAYFRSQRQIIIDAETLIKQKRRLAPDRYLARSASIGGDQQILRGRYSQFLGGEEEGAPEPPTKDSEQHSDDDGHDHGGAPRQSAPGFGAPEDVLAEFGHPHDDSPASSLDPETRAILKQAVDEMWQSELQLKQGHPDLALPFAYRALRFIKEVQQATRIFLSRVGPELPPIDASRRMTGKREGLASRVLAVAPVEGRDGPAAAAWRALGEGPGAIREPIALDSLDRWARDQAAHLPDPLALSGAIDAVRRDPACVACRAKLRALLWTAMARPPAHLARRRPADAGGARYLGAIGGGTP